MRGCDRLANAREILYFDTAIKAAQPDRRGERTRPETPAIGFRWLEGGSSALESDAEISIPASGPRGRSAGVIGSAPEVAEETVTLLRNLRKKG